jgi:alpha-glucosidase
MRRVWVSLVLALASAGTATPASAQTLTSGALHVTVSANPFRLAFADDHGNAVFDTIPGGGAATSKGAIGFRSLGRWYHARQATAITQTSNAISATLTTDDPLKRTIAIKLTPQGDGIIHVETRGPPSADALGAGFAALPQERFLGFGERSDAVVRAAGDVENHVSEGPYQPTEAPFVAAFVPLAGFNTRRDATYFPIPWLLSSRGAGLLIDDDARSVFRLGQPWSVEVDGHGMSFDAFAGPTPAKALQRFTKHVGRQPPAAAPFYFGPWWQPHKGDAQDLQTLQAAKAAGSVVQTYTHYLPCGAQHGNEAGQRARTAAFHAAGLAVTTYVNPMICTTYQPRFDQANARGLLTRDPANNPYVYRYTGASTFFVGQFDFTQPAARSFYGDLLDEAVQQGYDGWMEDFGEYTPPDAHAAQGQTGEPAHNRYVVDYHRAAYDYSHDRAPRPLARFNRSGWTGAAQYSQIVWGGDPSTAFDFDGLRSALRNGLTMGLSGVSLWGSDIGGYFALSQPQTTPDLLKRWIELGFASGVMRTEADGFALAPSPRAQIFDPGVLPIWTRYARLRTQLYPYLAAAEQEYDRSGLPLMRQLALVYPDDPRAASRDDEFLLGPDILAAPVLSANATRRAVYLPAGRWVDWWKSITLDADAAPQLTSPTILDGGREISVDAPADALPLFVRADAALTLLPADVRTLSNYGAGNTVRLADRAGSRRVLSWRSVVHIKQERRRRVELQLALARRPRCLTVGHKRVPFTYAAGVLHANIKLRDGTVRARSGGFVCSAHAPNKP